MWTTGRYTLNLAPSYISFGRRSSLSIFKAIYLTMLINLWEERASTPRYDHKTMSACEAGELYISCKITLKLFNASKITLLQDLMNIHVLYSIDIRPMTEPSYILYKVMPNLPDEKVF